MIIFNTSLLNLLEELGIRDVFTIPGSLMLLLGEIENNNNFNIYTASHEEFLGYMAIGYYLCSGCIPIILVTQGPGVTNLVTPLSCAWREHIPIIVISTVPSQAKLLDFQDSSGRFHSPNLKSILTPITESQLLLSSELQRNDLIAIEKCLRKASAPIFIEIAKDISNNQHNYIRPPKAGDIIPHPQQKSESEKTKVNLLDFLKSEKIDHNTGFLIGDGARYLDCESFFGYIQKKGGKIVSTLKSIGRIPSNTSNYIGNIGELGKDEANSFMKEQCTCLFAVGASLNRMTTAKWYGAFKRRDGKIISFANIDEIFPIALRIKNIKINFKSVSIPYCQCSYAKNNLPKNTIIKAIRALNNTCNISMESFRKTFLLEFPFLKGDHFLCSPGFAPLGCALPIGIGAAIANSSQPTIVFCGDGGFLFSGMALLTMKRYSLPICIIVFINGEYQTVAKAQLKLFGKTICTDLVLPKFENLEEFFDIKSYVCNTKQKVIEALLSFKRNPSPTLIACSDEILP
jgi:thiamine pyrophosphate-dependent acetolactate synthase large subunit-like protein